MGAKYRPTIKDQKAQLRFQLKQSGLPKLKNTAPGAGGKKPEKK